MAGLYLDFGGRMPQITADMTPEQKIDIIYDYLVGLAEKLDYLLTIINKAGEDDV